MRIGVAGLGVVGAGLLSLMEREAAGAVGGRFHVAGVSARDRHRDRGVDLSRVVWFDDAVALASDPTIDVFVELMGGAEGAARASVTAALQRGAHVVTANKALLAHHGAELAALSESKGGQLLFEAAVGGGVPIVKALRESLAGADVRAIAGILNGTCNYLLTEMERTGQAYEVVLAEAQRLGYAEADPTTDVGGFDAGHKIALLAAIAFAARPDFAQVEIEGVEAVTLLDIRMAAKLGYRIKLIARAERSADGVRTQVRPALVAYDHPLASIGGPLNAVLVDADPVGRLTFSGRGAGAGPTATAVMADLLDLAAGLRRPAFGRPLAQLRALAPRALAHDHERGRFYLRLLVEDKPGVIAAVSERLGREGVSIDSFLQLPGHDEPLVPIVLTTKACARSALDAAVQAIATLQAVRDPPRVLAVEDGETRADPWSSRQ